MEGSITLPVKHAKPNISRGDDRRDAMTDCSSDAEEMVRSLRSMENKERDTLRDALGIVGNKREMIGSQSHGG